MPAARERAAANVASSTPVLCATRMCPRANAAPCARPVALWPSAGTLPVWSQAPRSCDATAIERRDSSATVSRTKLELRGPLRGENLRFALAWSRPRPVNERPAGLRSESGCDASYFTYVAILHGVARNPRTIARKCPPQSCGSARIQSGNPAIVGPEGPLDRKLCAPGFHRVCPETDRSRDMTMAL